MGEYKTVILGAFVLNWFFCFIPGFEQPADPSAVDAALTFHIDVIKRDLTSQTCEKYKQLPADGLLQKDKALQELSHQKSHDNTGTTLGKDPYIRNLDAKVSYAERTLKINPLSVSCGTRLKESCGTL